MSSEVEGPERCMHTTRGTRSPFVTHTNGLQAFKWTANSVYSNPKLALYDHTPPPPRCTQARDATFRMIMINTTQFAMVRLATTGSMASHAEQVTGAVIDISADDAE